MPPQTTSQPSTAPAGSLSRRRFLQTAIVTPAVLAAPNIVTKPLWGAAAPSNQVRLGLIGCGNISQVHLGNLLPRTDATIVAVADAYRSRREAHAARLNERYGAGTTTAYADFRDILGRSDVDAVIIAVHDHWHTPMSIAAARAGKDVYCQKPLATDLRLTATLRTTIRETKRVFQFGTQYRSMKRHRQMIQLVRNGYIGQLQRIDVWCRDLSHDAAQYQVKPYGSTEPVPVPADLDYDAWMGPSEMPPYTVDRCTRWGGFHCPETSLGFIAGCGIHELGMAQWGNKSDHTSPVRYAGTGRVPTEGIFRTLERWDVACDYENGVKMRFMDCRTAKPLLSQYLARWRDGDGVIFHGTEGWISDGCGFQASDPKLWKVEFRASDETLPPSEEHNGNFIDCVRTRQEPMCPVEMAIRCDTICHLANAAAITGRTIRWDPVREQIIGDPSASQMLSRPFRPKWRIW